MTSPWPSASRTTGDLLFGDTYVGSATVDIPADAVNRMYLITVADSYEEVGEYDDENNTKYLKVWATPLVDLLITEVDAPDTALSGQTLSLSWTVENQGIGNTPTGQWRDVVYLSPDQYLDRSHDVYLGYYERNGALTPAGTEDDSYTAEFAAQIPFGLSGPYYVVRRDRQHQPRARTERCRRRRRQQRRLRRRRKCRS